VVAAETTTHHGSWVKNSNPHSQQGRRSQGCCPAERDQLITRGEPAWGRTKKRSRGDEGEEYLCLFCVGYSAGV